MRIGFLLNHDQTHQVAHSLPIALALAQCDPHIELCVATSNPRLEALVREMAGPLLGRRIEHVRLRLKQSLTRALGPMLNRWLPFEKLAIYGDNLDFFGSLDALVVTEKTSLLLKTHYHLDRLKLIHTRHGAGDRAIGFNAESALFDHVLVAGEKIRERLLREAGVAPERISVVGYPKFDLLPAAPARLPLQANGRPTVLYNPHPSPHLSSWYRMGRDVLRHFCDSDRYNLIFAPHVMLFQRKYVVTIDKLRIDRPGKIERAVRECPHIHVDLGGAACTDMTYTQAADIYLGDASSQVYEFLLRPRPCVFLNAQRTNYRNDPNYAHWRAGPVIARVEDLDEALHHAVEDHHLYRETQRAMFNHTFDLTGEPSAMRAARAIEALMQPRGELV